MGVDTGESENTGATLEQHQCFSKKHQSNTKTQLAFEQTRRQLADAACARRYDEFEAALLAVATGDPGAGNKQHFHGFYNWSVEQGLISRLQAKERYSRYFSTGYGQSLPDDANTCSLGKRKARVIEHLAVEAGAKKRGLLEISGDREAWFAAKRKHDDLVFLLETVSLACADAG